MAIKKSELYSSLWAGCDELRGSMDASQYKDYVLVLLFMKYVSDKGGDLVEIPEGASFRDMVRLKGQPDIGDRLNKIIGALAQANDLTGIITVADFNDDEKLGKGKEKVDKLSNLIEIFEKPELDFSSNRADGDDILGDAYEYLMRHFATESGKSKGQFYTPAEVSRIMAKVIGIHPNTKPSDTVYDPTCGSGSLLLKVADETPRGITIYGQENDNATRALAVMNMWLHGNPSADIKQGNTLASPLFMDERTGELKQFDFAVANPPFSFKAWMNGFNPDHDEHGRFAGYAVPPKKNGDFAFLLHLLKSLKSNGKACIVLPLGVLFRGNTEADIRRTLLKKGYIKGIIGLPANLFYGTGIAACLIVLDKETAAERTDTSSGDVFMIDASKGFIKDGNKNRLREQDIHKIVDTFANRLDIPKYSRAVPLAEIADPKNDYNLNIPRYIDAQEEEDVQDIEAHLLGGIPKRDVEALAEYWAVYPSLKAHLFRPDEGRPDYYVLTLPTSDINAAIFRHPEFLAFGETMNAVFEAWASGFVAHAKALDKGLHPKEEIRTLSESLLVAYTGRQLTDKYAMYQHIMDYRSETMQDDLYELSASGWAAGNDVQRIVKKTKKGDKTVEKEVQGLEGLEGRLIPPALMVEEYFADGQKSIVDKEAHAEALNARMEELAEEHGGEDGLLANALDDKGKISKVSLQKAIKALGKKTSDNAEEYEMLHEYKRLMDEEAETQAIIKSAKALLEQAVIAKYPTLTLGDIQRLVVEKKWLRAVRERVQTEMDNISRRLAGRIKELAERYETPLPAQTDEVRALEEKVHAHLAAMGFVWEES